MSLRQEQVGGCVLVGISVDHQALSPGKRQTITPLLHRQNHLLACSSVCSLVNVHSDRLEYWSNVFSSICMKLFVFLSYVGAALKENIHVTLAIQYTYVHSYPGHVTKTTKARLIILASRFVTISDNRSLCPHAAEYHHMSYEKYQTIFPVTNSH